MGEEHFLQFWENLGDFGKFGRYDDTLFLFVFCLYVCLPFAGSGAFLFIFVFAFPSIY